MIMARPNPIEEIIDEIKDFNKVLIAGCDGCVTVCEAGGIKEVQVVASALRLYFTKESKRMEIDETSLTRQCDKDYLHELLDKIDDYDAIVSLACGAGVQFMAEMYRKKPIFPGVDTCFIGVTEERGVWAERCQACGQCILASTGGICPISRCSKRMLNGPCGGSEKGKCEISPDTDCGWHLIYERLKELGQLDFFAEPTDPKDWVSSRDGGPRKIVREDVRL
ncbi:MAG: methylenetetrahydrofolate reductase C-terminal domain-containing protein [Deltaproteobacteria bacterium]|nr:methylenetetrahydrofolate reductase C-terminal domain-containing protein [Deltaproteobacteria bacterium]